MRRDSVLMLAGLGLVLAAIVPLHRVFSSTEWRSGVIATVLVATLLAAAARRFRLPAPASIALSVLGLLLFATQLHAVIEGPWPTPAALAELWRLVPQGFEEIRLEPSPAAPLAGIRLLLTAGTWAVAYATHEILVRLRRPGAALATSGLLWFTPLAVPVTGSPAWPNALPFVVAAGIVLLLEPDPDSSTWTHEDTAPRVPASGVAIVCVAAAIGLLTPWLTPGYNQPALVDVTAATEPRGYQPIVDVGDRLQLPRPRDVLEVKSTQQVYLRLAALDTFDGRTWRLGPPDVETFRPDPNELFRAEGPVPFETEILQSQRVDVSVRVLDLENIYVPVPYQVASIQGPDGAGLFYSRQGGFVATGDVEDNLLRGETRVGVRQGFEYEVQSVIPTPAYDDLRALGDVSLDADDPRVALPDGYEDFGDLAEQIARDAGATTTIDHVVAVQQYFIGADSPFEYSTDVGALRGNDALRDFTFASQTGYCEYFSTSMAVMLRAKGIPARVAVGFLPGRVTEGPEEEGGPATFRVSTSDAHAWVEVFFDQYGWVRMDPTPRGEAVPPTAEDFNPLREAGPIAPQPTNGVTSAPTFGPNEQVTDDIPGRIGGGIDAPGVQEDAPLANRWVVLGLVVLATGLLLAAAVYGRPRLRRALAGRGGDPAGAVLAAQRRVLDTAAHLGIGRAPSETVTEAAMRWARTGLVDPADAATFSRLGSQAAFGVGIDSDDAETMRGLETRLVAGFSRAVDRRQRLTAPWRHTASQVVGVVERGVSGVRHRGGGRQD